MSSRATVGMYDATERSAVLYIDQLGPILQHVRKSIDNPPLYRALGRKIASARVTRAGGQLSQSKLAAMVGLTRGSIANIELGSQRPPLHIVWAIGRALGVEPASLLPQGSELDDVAKTFAAEIPLEPKVERVLDDNVMGRAWLSATRSKVGSNASHERTRRRRK